MTLPADICDSLVWAPVFIPLTNFSWPQNAFWGALENLACWLAIALRILYNEACQKSVY